MTSREHARRLMLILLTSEGTALRKAADDRMMRRERLRPAHSGGTGFQGTGSTEVSGEARERGVEEWRLWAALPPLGAAPRAP
jgi:hypothetical protein